MRYTLTVCCVVNVNSLRELEECLEEVRYGAKSAISRIGIVTAVTSYPDSSGSAGLIGGGAAASNLPLESPEVDGKDSPKDDIPF